MHAAPGVSEHARTLLGATPEAAQAGRMGYLADVQVAEPLLRTGALQV